MSCRSSGGSRKRRSRRVWLHRDDDLPQSLFALFGAKSTRGRKRKMPPRKITTRRTAAKSPPRPTTSEVLTIDDSPESAEILNNVNSKIGSFMESGSFISSDEEETEMIKTKSNRKSSTSQFFISDDSDDECKVTNQLNTSDLDASEPSTSAGPSTDLAKDHNKSKGFDDDIMGFVNSVLDSTKTNKDENKQEAFGDMKSLEDFRKETEEMLKNASSLFEEIKMGRKPQPQPKAEEREPQPQPKAEESPNKVTIGACPICFESLADRPASVTVCGHIFCKTCILQTAQTLKKCPTCRKNISVKKIHPIYF